MMELWVLGCHTPYAPPGGACSGYWVRSGDDHVLLDCGSGVLAHLQRAIPLAALRTVILSHLHADHLSDLFSLQYGADANRRMGVRQPTIRIYAPDEPREVFDSLAYKEVTEAHPLTEATQLQLGTLSCTFTPTRHGLPTYAVRISNGQHSLVYTADTGYSEALVPFIEGADLLLAEATLSELDRGHPFHMSACEAGQLAARGHVGHLLLTHLHPQTREREWLQRARRHFDGSVSVAQAGAVYPIE